MRIPTLTLLAAALACSSGPPGTPTTEQPRPVVLDAGKTADTVHLTLGESVRLFPADLIVRFDRLVNDSRCPPAVQCVWAGSVRVGLFIAMAAGGGADVELETNGARDATIVAGYRLTLLPDVTPPPGEQGTYRIPLEVRRVGSS